MKPIAERSKTIRIILLSTQCLLVIGMIAGVLFISARDTNWMQAWLFLAVYAICNWICSYLLFLNVPELLDERKKKHANIKSWDKNLVVGYQIMYFPIFIVSGLDHQYYLTEMPIEWSTIFLLLVIFSFVLFTWAPLVNKHLETYIRIQYERNHQVCDKGPYRIIRHPSYLGLIFLFIGIPLSLGSLWGLIPGMAAVITIMIRTAFEDKFLKAELPGYTEYSNKTKYRLFPLIW